MNNKFKYGLIIFVIGVVLVFMTGMDAISFLKTPKEIYDTYDFETANSIKKGDHVIIHVQATLGNAISYVTYDKKTGKTTSENNRYYVLPFWNDNGSKFITVKVSKKDFNSFEKAEDAFYNYFLYGEGNLEDTFITVEGVARELTSEENKYVKEFSEEFDDYISTNTSSFYSKYCVDTKNKSVTIIMAIGGIVLAFIGILLIVLGIKQGKATSANNKALAASNYYTAPTNVSFNNDPNAAAQPQAPPQAFDPYSVQNDPRFAGAVNNAQTTVQNASNAADQAVTSFNEVKTDVQEAATTSFNEVPIAPIADVPPINPKDPLDK